MKKQANRNGKISENSAVMLQALGFERVSYSEYCNLGEDRPDRLLVKNYAYNLPWGGTGYREWCIDAVDAKRNRHVSGCNDRGSIVLPVEFKYQQVGGSTDEKLGLIPDAVLASKERCLYLVVEGDYWREKRGQLIVEWLKQKAVGLQAVNAYLCIGTLDEFSLMVAKMFPTR